MLTLFSEPFPKLSRFIFKNKKYTTNGHLRMIDALQELKSRLNDYGFILKICNCCAHFKPLIEGNMLEGFCQCDYPSPLLRKPKSTNIWNSCSKFSPARLNNIIEDIVKQS